MKANSVPRPNTSAAIKTEKLSQKTETAKNSTDLLGLDVTNSSETKTEDDSFGLFVSSFSTSSNPTEDKSEAKKDSKSKSDEESDFFNQKAPTVDQKVMTKESILSLYGSASPAPTLLAQPQQSVIGPQNPAFNASNQSLFMGQFAPTSQAIPPQSQNSMFMSQNTAVNGIQASSGQTSNLMSQVRDDLLNELFLWLWSVSKTDVLFENSLTFL